jgi:flavin reductase (DIM6/NTAB) family NADH-FMN oxidoreductase RutF
MHNEDTRGMDPQIVANLREMIYGLYFLSLGSMDQPQGMIVSWVSQVSGDPPLIMASVRENRGILPDLKDQGAFALNLLPPHDPGLLGRLARPAEERFEELPILEGALGLPLLKEALGSVSCQVKEIHQPGDHMLVVGEVKGGVWQGPGPAMSAATGGHAYLGLS